MKVFGIPESLSPTNGNTSIPTTNYLLPKSNIHLCNQVGLSFQMSVFTKKTLNTSLLVANHQFTNGELLTLSCFFLISLYLLYKMIALKVMFLFNYVMHFDHIHPHYALPLVP